jgi:squalene-hopene/tetraprenyl-beta-curcumene cyclase
VRARDAILAHGGVTACNTFTKIYLAIFGQYDWDGTPVVPPELALLPGWFYLNLYEVSSWSRTIIVPLAIVSAFRPYCPLPVNIDELFIGGRHGSHLRLQFARTPFCWRNFFLGIDRCLHFFEERKILPWRKQALKLCEQWMVARFRKSGGLGAIFPPIVNALMAMRCLGYADDHPEVVRARGELEGLRIEEGESLHLQPCLSPVWDTALATVALSEGGLSHDHPALQRAAEWLLSKEVRHPGDWCVKNRDVEPSGWYFEFRNEYYPDVDDTAAVLMALRRVRLPGKEAAVRRGIAWVLAMQGRDGGWASFDRDNDRMLFSQVPFADHNAMLDPSTADITGRVLEMLGSYGYDRTHAAVRAAIAFLLQEQEPDGAWYGRWGVNYIYGTWQVMKGLRAVGEEIDAPHIRRAAAWLASKQNPDGGWGESCATYDDPSLRGTGPSTPSQTAWALMGLIAAGDADSEPVRRGIDYLCDTQRDDGNWDEPYFTGTGFPRVFYLRYHLYRLYFPIFALGMYARACGHSK